jgi:hypothetical protein
MATRPKKSVRSSVLLPEDAYARISELAAANDVSAAWVIRHAVTEFLKTHGDQRALPLQLPKTKRAARTDHA